MRKIRDGAPRQRWFIAHARHQRISWKIFCPAQKSSNAAAISTAATVDAGCDYHRVLFARNRKNFAHCRADDCPTSKFVRDHMMRITSVAPRCWLSLRSMDSPSHVAEKYFDTENCQWCSASSNGRGAEQPLFAVQLQPPCSTGTASALLEYGKLATGW